MLPAKTKTKKTVGALKRAFRRTKQKRTEFTRIGFIVDATSSREPCWETAHVTQSKMFRAVAAITDMRLRVIHFGGEKIGDLGWQKDAMTVSLAMAKVRCEFGYTQILASLRKFLLDPAAQRAKAVILVSDSFEEDEEEALRLANKLRAAGIKIYSFLDGDCPDTAHIFKMLAEKTGGAFAHFGDDIPLDDLCEAVALISSGNDQATKQIKNEKVKRLLLEERK